MSEVVQLRPQRAKQVSDDGIIRKVVDGKIIELVNLDALPPSELPRYLECVEE